MARAPARKYSPRRSRDERREQLLDATLRLVDAEGFDAFSIEAVAREADLAKTVVYATFGGREELLRALVDRELARAAEEMAKAIPNPPKGEPSEVLGEALTNILEAARARPRTWRLFLLPPDGMPLAARANVEQRRRQLLRAIEPLVAWGLERSGAELDVEIGTQALIAGGEQGIRMMLADPDRYPSKRLVDFTLALLRPFLSPPA